MLTHSDLINELRKIVENYQPSSRGVQALDQAAVTIFAGITGAGKNTVISELLKTGEYYDLVTSTTRPPRVNNGVAEEDKVDYYFLSLEESRRRLLNQEYIEASIVHENVYGLLEEEIDRAAKSGKKIITDVDVNGVDIYHNLSSNSSAVFIIPPDYQTWYDRTVARYKTKEEYEKEWPIRHASAIKELKTALSKPYYHFVINGLLEDTIKSVKKVLKNRDLTHLKNVEMRQIANNLLAHFESAK